VPLPVKGSRDDIGETESSVAKDQPPCLQVPCPNAPQLAFARRGGACNRRPDERSRDCGQRAKTDPGTPEHVLEFGSYHAIVACVAAGSGIALVPHSVVRALHAEREVSILPLPTQFTEAMTFLVWPRAHRSAALDALRRELNQEKVG
jgi:DNA-binding transcriptional LysR family regulator